MYPQPELSRGSARKAAVRRSIAVRRAACVEAAAQAVQPLVLIDRGVALWSQLAPWAGIAVVALGLRRARAAVRRRGLLGMLWRWAPVLLGVLRLFRSGGEGRVKSSETAASAARHD